MVPFSLLVFAGDLITAKSFFSWFSSFWVICFEICYWVVTVFQEFFHISFPSHWIWLLTAVPTYFYFIQVLHFIEPSRRYFEKSQCSCWCSCAVCTAALVPHWDVPWLPPIAYTMRPFQISQDSGEDLVNSQSSPGLLWVHSQRTQPDLGAENP